MVIGFGVAGDIGRAWISAGSNTSGVFAAGNFVGCVAGGTDREIVQADYNGDRVEESDDCGAAGAVVGVHIDLSYFQGDSTGGASQGGCVFQISGGRFAPGALGAAESQAGFVPGVAEWDGVFHSERVGDLFAELLDSADWPGRIEPDGGEGVEPNGAGS